MTKKKNHGFTIVEIIVTVLIISILAAIIIPVTLSFIDSSSDVDVLIDGKSIWNAVQTEFTKQASTGELWVSTTDNQQDKLKKQGMIFDQYQVLTNGKTKTYMSSDFQGCYLYIGNMESVKNVFSKIDNWNNLSDVYILAGRVNTYYRTENNNLPYSVFAVIFKYVNENDIYYFDGIEVSTDWIFSKPESKDKVTGNEVSYVLKNKDYELQVYCLKNKSNKTAKIGDTFKAFVNP